MPLFLGIGAGVGALKYFGADQPKAAKERQLAAATQRYSPWTGMQAKAPENPSALGDVLSTAGAGAQLGGAINSANAAGKMSGAMSNLADQQALYYNNLANGGGAGQLGGWGMMNQQPGLGNYNFGQPAQFPNYGS